jgi:hypothetical protein
MITVEHQDDLTIVGVFGELVLADYRQFEQEVLQQLQTLGRVNVLIDLRAMLAYTLDVALEDVKFTRDHAAAVGRIAIVSGRVWAKWTAFLSQLFVHSELRVFDTETAAREWLAES